MPLLMPDDDDTPRRAAVLHDADIAMATLLTLFQHLPGRRFITAILFRRLMTLELSLFRYAMPIQLIWSRCSNASPGRVSLVPFLADAAASDTFCDFADTHCSRD